MDWSQISTGALVGGVGTLLLQAAKQGFEHFLAERKQRADEGRAIRAEQRQEERKENERRRAEADKLKRDADIVEMFKIQVRGARDLAKAATVVFQIHEFFERNPEYASISDNRRFLEKYANDFCDHVRYGRDVFSTEKASGLAVLQTDVQSLKIQ